MTAARLYSKFKGREVGKPGSRPSTRKGMKGAEASGNWGIKEGTANWPEMGGGSKYPGKKQKHSAKGNKGMEA